MSHFSTIKTKIKDKFALLRALQVLGHNTDVDQKLENPADHNHDEVVVQVAVGKDIGFRLNPSTKTYELVTDLQTWDQPIPVERFLNKLSQQYAVETITESAKNDDFHVTQQTTNTDGSIELVVERWK